jgi:fibronectin type 3 domain-containing protein
MNRIQAVNRWLLKSAILGLLPFLAVTTSTVADTTSPAITSVSATADPIRVIIVFNEPVEVTSATNVGNYNIDNGIIIFSASLSTDLKTVTLGTSAHVDGLVYNLTINNAQDASGNVMPETSVTYPFILGLVGYWRLDEGTGTTVSDATGTGNTGIFVGNPIWTTGITGQALSFTSPSTYVVVPDSSSLRISTDEMTVAAWVKINSFPLRSSNTDPAIVEKDGSEFMLGLAGSNSNTPRFRLTTTSGTVTVQFGSSSVGRWYHYVGVYDGSKMRLYESGVLIGSKAQSGTIDMSTVDLNIGHRSLYNSYVDGTIDEVRIYNRALTGVEVQALYNSTPDTTPPSTPTNLEATVISSSRNELSWTASTDNFEVTGYRVFRNGTQIGTPNTTFYQDTGLSPLTTYSYTVVAIDAAGNESAESVNVSAKTLQATPPSTPTSLQATVISLSQINLSWTASTDDVGVIGYRVFRDGAQIAITQNTTYADTSVRLSTTYTYTISAFDAAGHESALSSSASATTQDLEAGSLYLTWTDNSLDEAGFKIERKQGESGTFAQITTIGADITSYIDSGLVDETTYCYRVRAFNGSLDTAYSNESCGTTKLNATPGVFVVSPSTGLSASGDADSPFSPSSKSYTLTNTGGTTINYTISKGQSWVSLSQTSGSLAPGESTSVTVSINSNANSLAANTYSDTVSFTNTTNGDGNTSRSASISVAVPGSASTITLTYSTDTFINANSNNYSQDTRLNTFTWPTDQIANAILMKWDLSAIPEGSTIHSATLNLYLQGYVGNGGDTIYDISVHKIINKDPIIAQSSGFTYDGSNPWTANNCCLNGIPLAQADIAAAEDAKSVDKTNGFKTWTVTQMVQEWFINPSTNFGMLINSDPLASAGSNRTFSSSEHPQAAQRPELVITYSTVNGIPNQPTGLTLQLR